MALFESYERRINQIQPVLDKYGIKEKICYNHAKKEKTKQPNSLCEKERAIYEAFMYYKMI